MKKLLPKTVNNPQGFTLIELLVVIVIIAILSIIGISIFSGTQKNARDSRRKGDIQSISRSFEANYVAGAPSPYPAPIGTWFAGGSIPKDPQGGEYYYNGTQNVPTTSLGSFVICADLENTTGGNSSNNNGAAASNGGFYCLRNQQ